MKFTSRSAVFVVAVAVLATVAWGASTQVDVVGDSAVEVKDPTPPFVDPNAAPPVIDSTGGPDAFGYVYIDSNEPGGPIYSWADITGTGTLTAQLGDDAFVGPYPIGFSFPFYGVAQTEFYVGSNGFISFGAGSTSLGNQCPLPSASTPNNLIALLWDDLDPGDTSDPVYYQTFASCPVGSGQCLIVSYIDFCHYPGGASCASAGTWQVILYENGSILLQFLDPGAETGASSTSGIEGPDGTAGLSYGTCNTPDSIAASLAVLYQLTGWQLSAGGPTAQAGSRGDAIDYTLTIANNESTARTFDISYTGSGWGVTGPSTVGPVPSGGSQDFTVTVIIPLTIPQCETDVLTVSADDQSNPGSPQSVDLTTSGPGAEVTYDNGPLVTHPGGGAGGADASAVQSALGLTLYGTSASASTGYRVADDFTIPAGESWDLDQIVLFAYQTGSTTTSTFNEANVQIWDGDPSAGGAVIFGDTTTNRLASSGWSNIYRVLDTTLTANNRPIMASVADVGTTLGPGTYWVDYQLGGTLSSGPWVPPISILGQTDTGNALQQTVSTGAWAPVVDGTFLQGVPFQFSSCREAADWGDAPDLGYPTTRAQNGASHALAAVGQPLVHLGSAVDADDDGHPSPSADGDDTTDADDEDGVTFTSPINPGMMATVDVVANGSGLFLQAWIDFNADGDWDDAGEQIFTNQALSVGVNNLAFMVPASATPFITTYARFRASSEAGIGYSGPAPDGEVEDYEVGTVPVELQSFTIE